MGRLWVKFKIERMFKNTLWKISALLLVVMPCRGTTGTLINMCVRMIAGFECHQCSIVITGLFERYNLTSVYRLAPRASSAFLLHCVSLIFNLRVHNARGSPQFPYVGVLATHLSSQGSFHRWVVLFSFVYCSKSVRTVNPDFFSSRCSINKAIFRAFISFSSSPEEWKQKEMSNMYLALKLQTMVWRFKENSWFLPIIHVRSVSFDAIIVSSYKGLLAQTD